MKIGKSSIPYILLLIFIVSTAHFMDNRKRKWNNNHLSYEINGSNQPQYSNNLFAAYQEPINTDSLKISNF